MCKRSKRETADLFMLWAKRASENLKHAKESGNSWAEGYNFAKAEAYRVAAIELMDNTR